MEKKFLESFKVFLAFPEKWFVFFDQIWHYKALSQYSMAQKIFRVLVDFKTNL